jgi:N-acetylmuramic acid 6-phosphate etherase
MADRRKVPSPTEQRNPRSSGLDLKTTRDIVRVLNREDARVSAAIARELPAIARAIDVIVAALRRGGRLIYVGAGTSGRLAALDAAECPPTFGTSPNMVQAVIAGGRRALTHAVEGAEDNSAQAKRDLAAKKVTARDVVVGLAASGSTPYVLAALEYARRRGAATIGITSHPHAPIRRVAQITIAPNTGPEVIVGSTRMKAGTAQKLVLNMLSTATMVRLGYVYDHWMAGVALTNRKLLRRGLRILEQATGANLSDAEHALGQAGHDLRVALVMLKSRVDAGEARRRLASAGGNVREALGESGRRPKPVKARKSKTRK